MTDLMYEAHQLSRTYGELTDGQEMNKAQHSTSHKYSPIN